MISQTKILKGKERKEIETKLEEQFGISKIPGEILMRGKERLFFYSGNLNSDSIKNLESLVFIERIGIYFAKMEENGEIRLSIDGAQIFKEQISKNIFQIPKELVEKWMMGNELNIKSGMKGFVIVSYNNEFLGTGKASEEKISNFIPKNRRLKEKR